MMALHGTHVDKMASHNNLTHIRDELKYKVWLEHARLQ